MKELPDREGHPGAGSRLGDQCLELHYLGGEVSLRNNY